MRGFLFHQIVVFIVFEEGHRAADAGFTIHKAPGEEADLHAPVEQQVDLAAEAFGVDDRFGEHVDVHQLVLAVIEELLQALTKFLLEDLLGLLGLAGHPGADDGVHRVVGGAAVHRDPAQFHLLRPFGKFAVWTWMFDHVADLIRGGLIPAEVVVTGMDDQDIAFFDFDPVFDHFAGVDIIITADIAQVDDGGIMHQVIHGQ